MKNLITRLFGKHVPAVLSQGGKTSSRDNPLTIEDGSDNATRRQLVQVLLRDALRKYGIPPRWIDCQMLLVSSRSRGPGMYVRLVVRQWDDRLLTYAHAFQTALMLEITRFEPQATQWLHGISWQLEVADTCPHRTMPDRSFWDDPVRPAPQPMISRIADSAAAPIMVAVSSGASAAVAAAAAATAAASRAVPAGLDSDAMKDLERLFLIRDQELGRGLQTAPGVGYESTQPSPL